MHVRSYVYDVKIMVDGDLSRVPIEIPSTDEIGLLATAFNRLKENFNGVLHNIQRNTAFCSGESPYFLTILSFGATKKTATTAKITTINGATNIKNEFILNPPIHDHLARLLRTLY